jgi:rubrerythrin
METKIHDHHDDLIKRLVVRLKEELTDVETYNELYEYLESHHMYEEADVIEEIARDEFSHADAICDMLKELGYDFSEPGLEMMWQRAYHAFHMTY